MRVVLLPSKGQPLKIEVGKNKVIKQHVDQIYYLKTKKQKTKTKKHWGGSSHPYGQPPPNG